MKKKKVGQKTHKWGPVAEVDSGALMTACQSLGCMMDLSVESVPLQEYADASAFLNAMKEHADRSLPCPFTKSALYERMIP